jgi:uncharacterized repeat protein (TIGR03803 family)
VLQDSGANNITVSANGSFSFSTPLLNGATYAVSVLTQPAGQTCAVTSGSGAISGASVTSVLVACTVNSYTISGTASGLHAAAPITLLNNGGDTLTVKANGPFTFAAPVLYNGNYAVSVAKQPPAEMCTVLASAGTGVVSNVSNVGVTCTTATESVIHTFDPNPDGFYLATNALQAADGNFYGTTQYGGTSGRGTVYKITPAGVHTVIYSFAASGTADGEHPAAALIQGSDGNFYGTTLDGGAIGDGTVFQITPAGVETVIHSFAGYDGIGPLAALVQGSDGNFYGTTYKGGANSCGTVFKITPAGALTVLYAFAGGTTDGTNSTAALIQASDGNFYGTTQYGGTGDGGIVFKVTPAGVETAFHFFNVGTDGAGSTAALIQDSDGNFYGTTPVGGGGYGTVFKITPAGVFTVLHSFSGVTDGSSSYAPLIQGNDGNFYGTTQHGGATGNGTAFKITPVGVETVLYAFKGGSNDGAFPVAAPIQASDGNFYCTTVGGGLSGSGTLIQITSTGLESVVFSFNSASEGLHPSDLIQGDDGSLYGTTNQGGTHGAGSVFKITPDGVETVLYSFVGGATDGSNPSSALVRGSDGNFYGTTQNGGSISNGGTVFRVTPSGVETTLYSFAGASSDANQPSVALIQGSDGNFYGTTATGGTSGNGTVFRVTPSGVETVLYSFTGGTNDASEPKAALIQGGDDNFYGTTVSGGTSVLGTVFKVTPAGVETVLHSFAGGSTDGRSPTAALIQGGDGNLYGTTDNGGASDQGTTFMITPAGIETMLYAFSGGTTDGSGGLPKLTQGSDGNLYGTSVGGGTSGNGTLFEITPTGVETVLYSFEGGNDGSNPGALLQGLDGIFYGTTANGGSTNAGTLFKF